LKVGLKKVFSTVPVHQSNCRFGVMREIKIDRQAFALLFMHHPPDVLKSTQGIGSKM
jgi:hypothetical protein